MTKDEMCALGNDSPVTYRGSVVTFVCCTMSYTPWSARKHPMKARIRLLDGREVTVFASQISAVSADKVSP